MSALMDGENRDQYPMPVSGAQPPSAEVRDYLPEFEEAVDLRDYLDIIFRRKWLILTFMVCVFITTLIVTFSMKPVYKADGRLEFALQDAKVTKFEDVMASQLQTREFMQTQVQLLKSPSLAQRVIDKLQLEKHLLDDGADGGKEGLFHSWKRMIKKSLLGRPADGQLDEEFDAMLREKDTEEAFSERLDIQPQRDTTIIGISFNFTDPALVRDVVNTLIQEFIGWRMDSKIDSASTAKQQLEKQVQIARIQVEKSEAALNDFAHKAGIVSLEPRLNAVYRQLEETNSALAEARTRRISKEAAYQEVQDGDVSSLPKVVDSELIHDLRKSLVELLAEYEELSATFKEDYPKVKTLSAKMQDVEKKIAGEEQRIANAIKKDYLTSLKEEEALAKDAEDKKQMALALNDQATQYKILEREVETNKEIHQSLMQRFKEIDANVGTDISNIHIIDYATLPLLPYKPRILLNLALAIVVGLIGGVGLAFLLEYMDNTIKRLDEISDRFRISLLGVLPQVTTDETTELDYMVSTKPKSSFSEAIRTTKVSIQLSSSLEKPPKLILITSTSAGEGKSTTACNLAQAFAASEEKVIILDCDLRKPRLHRVFGPNGKSKGLSQFLSGMCEQEAIVRDTRVPGLDFISAGPVPPNPAELLASSRMRKLLKALSEQYDRVIVDGPPAAGFADVLVLGNHVDGVILVSTLGQTHREALRVFRRSIHNVNGRLLGCIVNKFNVTYRYGNYYYKYYKYYHYSYKPYGDNVDQLTVEPAGEKAESPEANPS
mgnify:FL=1